MSYQLVYHEKPAYLHIVVTGPNNLDTILGYMEEALGECVQRDRRRVLLEHRLEGPRMKMLDIFQVASEVSLKARAALDTLAFVDVFAEGDGKLLKFAGNVAASRGLKIRIFPTVAEAEKWLLAGGTGDH